MPGTDEPPAGKRAQPPRGDPSPGRVDGRAEADSLRRSELSGFGGGAPEEDGAEADSLRRSELSGLGGEVPEGNAVPPAGQELDPTAAELAAIEALYEAGDFREVNRRAGELARSSADAEVKARALALQDKVHMDPFVLWAWAGTALLVAGVVYYYVLR
jgi:hypothetical protein